MKDKEVTIYDIAERLNLNPSTISRGLKGHYTVSQKTQKKIRAAAEAMGYRSNTFAANLRNRRTNTIGVIIPKLNSYFVAQTIAGMEKVINDAGYNLIISQSLESTEKEARNVKTLFNNRVDGLLVSLAEDTTDLAHFDPFIKKRIPVLFFDRAPQGADFPTITINNEDAGYQVTKHLIEQGASAIVHITGSQLRNVYADRLAGYRRALTEAGIAFRPENIITNDLSEQAGINSAEQIIRLKADAVFVANDNCAASCMNELKRRGILVPQQVMFAGFNNDMISRNVDPPLTTVNYPGFEMGELAAKSILQHMQGNADLHITSNITIKSGLIIRASSQRINN